MPLSESERSTGRQYDRFSRVYDQTFGVLVAKRQRRAVSELRAVSGQWVLDMGIGTGMTLGYYPAGVQVVGVDLSMGMLRRAAAKVPGAGHIQSHLLQANALDLPFADHQFDHILITHVISVVSDPIALLHEAYRLVKPGGRVVILNHFHCSKSLLGGFEKYVNPICKRVGWKSDLQLTPLLDNGPLQLEYQFKLGVWDLWQILVMRREAEVTAMTDADGGLLPSADRSLSVACCV